METLTINIKNKKELSIIKKLLKAFDIEFNNPSDEEEITNPELLKRLDEHCKNFDNKEYRQENYTTVDTNNLWESILSK